MVEHWAARRPDHPAISAGADQVTYAELAGRAKGLAKYLQANGTGPGDVLAVRTGNRLHGVIGLFGVLLAGATYVALDPDAPVERIRTVMDDSGAALMLDEHAIAVAGEDAAGFACQPAGHGGIAYIVYTSGTTGTPKGVCVTYEALGRHLGAITARFGLCEDDRVLYSAAPFVDVALEQVLAPILAGGTLVVLPEGLHSAAGITGLIAREEVTVANLPAAYLAEVTRSLADRPLPAGHRLRLMISGGERLSAGTVERWMRHAPDVGLLNAYGPTECVVTATAHDVGAPDSATAPIGVAVGDRRLYVLDSRLRPVDSGELYVGGEPLAVGYLGRPALTARVFIPDPFSPLPGTRMYRTGDLVRRRTDGTLEYVGRSDAQIKIRGFRVEPAETQAVLERHPDVGECAVVGVADARGDYLAAYVVPGSSDVTSHALMRFLADRLPAHLLPRELSLHDRLPRTRAGKLDHAELTHVVPRPFATATEELLAEVWREVLGVDSVSRDSDFFELGGDSLTAIRITTRLIGTWDDVSPQGIFETPVLADLAARLDAEAGRRCAQTATTTADADDEAVSHDDDGMPAWQPLPAGLHGIWMDAEWHPGSAIYNVPWVFRLTGRIDDAALEHAVNAIMARHEALRTVFMSDLGEPLCRVLRHVPIKLQPEETADLDAVIDAEARRPIELHGAPLIRFRLLRSGPVSALVVVAHHLIWDEESRRIFEAELSKLYEAASTGRPARLPALPARGGDPDAKRDLAYWGDRLAGAPLWTDLPTDLPRPAELGVRGAVVPFDLPAPLVEKVRVLARSAGVTPFMVLLTCLCLVLRNRSGQDDLVVGTPSSRRSPATADLIGCYVNVVPLRIRLDRRQDRTDVRGLLNRVRRDVLADLTHGDVPFDLVVRHVAGSRSLDRVPLTPVALEMHRHAEQHLRLGDAIGSRELIPTGTAKFEVAWQITDHGDRISGVVEFNTDLYTNPTVTEMIAEWLAELAALQIEEV
ncbi:amino acid adenylation domain-containing protein [Saccharothrix coeruleofusca]|uniref:non-ribosomal peptide synthetase n=1 Tax=Saccharothrix coeruleofusca TaxID=33919 RepID=UPI001AE8E54F|nr:non-ribosomal peptide synthetase [Saccharothrix coeruleofusca]MBP2336044.1 amino acid adenylation domain-containing protein [Saccharothrix coeruleofusca]